MLKIAETKAQVADGSSILKMKLLAPDAQSDRVESQICGLKSFFKKISSQFSKLVIQF